MILSKAIQEVQASFERTRMTAESGRELIESRCRECRTYVGWAVVGPLTGLIDVTEEEAGDSLDRFERAHFYGWD